jgi:hypothetical protein
MATRKSDVKTNDAIGEYAKDLAAEQAKICRKLRSIIDTALPKATSRIWHGSPVWFMGENPVTGYSTKAGTIALLFWNGQSFKEAGLSPVGKFHAAEARFNSVSDIELDALKRWLRKARTDIFDSVSMIKNNRASQSRNSL